MVAAVSLLDNGNETITVYPPEQTADDRGKSVWRPSTVPVVVRCRVQPEATDESAVAVQATTTTYRVIARDAPLGPWARVEWDGMWSVNHATTTADLLPGTLTSSSACDDSLTNRPKIACGRCSPVVLVREEGFSPSLE